MKTKVYKIEFYGQVNPVLSLIPEYRTSDWGMPQEDDYFGPILESGATEQPHAMCRYRAYRAPPGQHDEYLINKTWLHVFAARLAFVAVFEV